MNIRPADISDVPRITELFADGMNEQNDSRFLLEVTPSMLAEQGVRYECAVRQEEQFIAVGEDDQGEIVGYVWVRIARAMDVAHCGQVNELVVSSGHRRQGIGTGLLQLALGWFAAKDLSTLEVNFSVDNPSASAFWAAKGFEPFFEKRRMKLPNQSLQGTP